MLILIDLLHFYLYLHFLWLILISAGNFLLMFLGWEGVGLTSYLLINFFHHRIDANKSAIKAVIVNRIGDFFFFFFIVLIVFIFKCLDFILISLLIPFFVNFKISLLGNDYGVLTIISLFLVLAA